MQRVGATLVLLLFAAASSETSAATRSGKKRWIGCVVGTGAGFFAGMVVGFHYFDDATYSTRKVLGTSLAFATAGGTGGYLLGRKWDKPSASRERALPLSSQPRWSRPLPAPLSPGSLTDRLGEVMCLERLRLSSTDFENCAHAHQATARESSLE